LKGFAPGPPEGDSNPRFRFIEGAALFLLL